MIIDDLVVGKLPCVPTQVQLAKRLVKPVPIREGPMFRGVSSSLQWVKFNDNYHPPCSISRCVRCFPIKILVVITAHVQAYQFEIEVFLLPAQVMKVYCNAKWVSQKLKMRPTGLPQKAAVCASHQFFMVTKPCKSPAYYSAGPVFTSISSLQGVPN